MSTFLLPKLTTPLSESSCHAAKLPSRDCHYTGNVMEASKLPCETSDRVPQNRRPEFPETEAEYHAPSSAQCTNSSSMCHRTTLSKYYRRSRTNRQPLSVFSILICNLLLLPALNDVNRNFMSFSIRSTLACHPGRPIASRPSHRKLTPLVLRQHVPNVSEKTIGASGPSEGKIVRGTKRYKEELEYNWNTNIVFKDEEQTNADRLMTKVLVLYLLYL